MHKSTMRTKTGSFWIYYAFYGNNLFENYFRVIVNQKKINAFCKDEQF